MIIIFLEKKANVRTASCEHSLTEMARRKLQDAAAVNLKASGKNLHVIV